MESLAQGGGQGRARQNAAFPAFPEAAATAPAAAAEPGASAQGGGRSRAIYRRSGLRRYHTKVRHGSPLASQPRRARPHPRRSEPARVWARMKLPALVLVLGVMLAITADCKEGRKNRRKSAPLIDCDVRAAKVKGNEFVVRCPPGCREKKANVWGSAVYASISSICAAAIHSGAVENQGGAVRVRKMAGQANYRASVANGVRSLSLPKWSGSFTLSASDAKLKKGERAKLEFFPAAESSVKIGKPQAPQGPVTTKPPAATPAAQPARGSVGRVSVPERRVVTPDRRPPVGGPSSSSSSSSLYQLQHSHNDRNTGWAEGGSRDNVIVPWAPAAGRDTSSSLLYGYSASEGDRLSQSTGPSTGAGGRASHQQQQSAAASRYDVASGRLYARPGTYSPSGETNGKKADADYRQGMRAGQPQDKKQGLSRGEAESRHEARGPVVAGSPGRAQTDTGVWPPPRIPPAVSGIPGQSRTAVPAGGHRVAPAPDMNHAVSGGNPECKVDVVFLLDGSWSIGKRRFAIQKNFLVKVTEALGVGPEGAAIGIMQYGDESKTEFSLKSYNSAKETSAAILNIPQRGGLSNVGRGLREVFDTVFLDENGNRGRAPNVVVVLLDGWPTDKLGDAARLSRESGINIFMVTVEEASSEEKRLLPEPDYVNQTVCRTSGFFSFSVPSWFAVHDFVNPLVERVCDTDQLLCSKTCLNSADIAFVVDGSSSVGYNNFRTVLEFVANISQAFDISDTATRIGLVQYTYEQRTEFAFADHSTKADVVAAVRRVNYWNGGTSTGAAISYTIANLFSTSKPNKRKILIIITDGRSYDDVRGPSSTAHSQGIIGYSIGIAWAAREELQFMASEPHVEHMFFVDDFEAVYKVVPQIISNICKEFNQQPRN
uniref:Cochlin n=2 Tax=Petromyzon marinus TaxID=7757 RepID=A0AAJ7SRY4_PETMA|nr:vitrin isoform X5 [Petromyzon marinus]